MANVLIASLGDHPTVVPAMVKALREIAHLELDVVHILYPGGEASKKDVELGYMTVEDYLKDTVIVEGCKFDFADPNTTADSMTFLRALVGILEACERRGDTVYLSLAGGRKNMSALMAVITQFFPCVRGLYHLIDKEENTFPTATQLLWDYTKEDQRVAMSPPLEQLSLVEIPYQHFADAMELRKYFASEKRGESYAVHISSEGDSFFSDIFQPERRGKRLEVWLSRTAYEQYIEFHGTERAGKFRDCFQRMQTADNLRNPARMHGTWSHSVGTLHFYKRHNSAERPLYYTLPGSVHDPNADVQKVIVCGLAVKKGRKKYSPTEEELLANLDAEPYKKLSELDDEERVLLVPLGESPMIASQTFTLLQQTHKVPVVAVIYPERNGTIKRGARLLQKLFEERDITGKSFKIIPIHGLDDVDDTAKCKTYLQAIMGAIEDLRREFPDKQVVLSLSGGRKGMSALTLFAAQRAGVSMVYHTLITDSDLEAKVERECNLDALKMLREPKKPEQMARLFLEKYDESKFTLFPIPVIALESQGA